MKKALSILLTFIMLLSMSVSVFAIHYNVYSNKNFATSSSYPSTYSHTQPGSAGKLATDVVSNIKNDAVKEARIYIGAAVFGAAVKPDGTKNHDYLAVKANIKPNKVTKMQFLGQNGNYIAMPVSYNKLPVGKWTTVLMYLDYTAITTDNYASSFPKSTIYINGVKYNEYTTDKLANRVGMCSDATGNTVISNLFFAFQGYSDAAATTQSTVDVDIADIQVYATNTCPADTVANEMKTPAFINNDALTLVGHDSLVNLAIGATAAKITTAMNEKDSTATYNVVAYDGTTELAADAELAAGNTLVLEKKYQSKPDGRGDFYSKTYAYYTVNTVAQPQAPKLEIYDGVLPTGYVQGNGSVISAAGGLMGKAASDKVMKFTQTGKNGGITKEGRLFAATTGFAAADKNGTIDYKYFVMDFSVLPKNGVGLNFMSTQYAIQTVPAAAFNQGQWNKVRIVIDYSDITDPYNTVTPDDKTDTYPKGNIYINGEHYQAEGAVDYMCASIGGRFGMYESQYAGAANTTFRFELLSTTDTDLEAYVDDMYAELTNTDPGDNAAATKLPELTTTDENVTVLDGVITTTAQGLGDVLTAPAGATVEYVEADGITTATDINDAAYVYVKPAEGLHNTYKVSNINIVKIPGADGVIAIASNVPHGATLFVAEYAGNKMVNIAFDNQVEEGNLSIDFTMEDAANNTVKAFFFDSTGSIEPLSKVLVG